MHAFLKKLFSVLLCFALCGTLLTLTTSGAAALFASDSAALAAGYGVRVGSEGSKAYYSTLSAAVSAATAGSTITVFGDLTTSSTITVNKNGLTFTGTGSVTCTTGRVFVITSADVHSITFSGGITLTSTVNSVLRVLSHDGNAADTVTVTVDHATLRSENNTPLWVGAATSTAVIVRDSTLYGGGYYGIFFARGAANTLYLENSSVYGKQNGIHVDYGTDLYLYSGTVNSDNIAVYVAGTTEKYGNTEATANDKTSHIHLDGTQLYGGKYGIAMIGPTELECTVGTVAADDSYAVYAPETAADITVNVYGGAFQTKKGAAVFGNNSEDATFDFDGGFSAAGGDAVFNDTVTPANNIAYADGANVYADKGFYTYGGAQVRLIPDTTGIRFISRLDADALAYLEDRGAEDIAFGTLLLPLDNAAELPMITKAELDKAGVPYADVKGRYGVHYDAETGYTVKAAVVRLQDKNVLRDLTAVGYVTYTIGGTSYTQYSAWSETAHARNMGAVARAALADGGYTESETALLNTFAHFQNATIAGNTVNNTTYEIVISTKNDFSEYYTALAIAEHLLLTTGYELGVVTASETTGKKQIRVGKAICSAAVPTGANAYAVAVNGSALEIAADNYFGYEAARDKVNEIFSSSLRTCSLAASYRAAGSNTSAAAAVAGDRSHLRIMVNNVFNSKWFGTQTVRTEATYNIHQRMDLAFSVYEAYHPDVLGLQEYQSIPRNALHSRLIDELGYTEVPVESTCAATKNATPLYYNAGTVELLDYGYFWYRDIDYGNAAYSDIMEGYSAATVRGRIADGDTGGEKGITWAIFREKRTGTVFMAGSTHFWWKGEMDEDELARVISAIYVKELLLNASNAWLAANDPSAAAGSMPIFFGGDLNTSSTRPAFKQLDRQTAVQSGAEMNTVFKNLNDLSVGETITQNTHHGYADFDAERGIYCKPAYSNQSYSGTIDYLFTNESAIDDNTYTVARMSWVGDMYGHLFSDHSPIFADIDFALGDDLITDLFT